MAILNMFKILRFALALNSWHFFVSFNPLMLCSSLKATFNHLFCQLIS